METSLIRVCDAGGETHGTGFVLSDSLAVTCAHVVEACRAAPGGRVGVMCHVQGDRREAEVLPEFWRASDGDDIAVLRLLSEGGRLPEGLKPLTLGSARHCNGHTLRTAGFSALPGGYEFTWAEGQIRGVVPHPKKQAMLQMDAKPILKGMSGAPVLDLNTQRVVGMVSELKQGAPLEWATTSDTLAAICPDLRLHPPQAVEDYLKAVAQFCRDLPYVSLKSDVPLETVYVRQQVRQELKGGQRTSDEEATGEELAGPELRARPMTVIQALEQHPRLVVMGGPGAGKSTLLRHLVQGLAEGTSDWHPHLPILVSLRGLAEREGDLTTSLRQQIQAELSSRLLVPLPKNFLTDWTEQTEMPWLIALDGMDEIVDAARRCLLIRELKQAAWPTGSHVLITTRSDMSADLNGFTTFDLLQLEPEQVKEFAHNWFMPDEAGARAFLTGLQAARMGDVIRTPLLLTVAATVFEKAPETGFQAGLRRSRLFAEFVRILLAEDAAPNRRMKEQFCQQFRTDLGERLFEFRREVLESIALALQEGWEVRRAVVKCLEQVVGWSAQDAARKVDDVLKILAQQRTGLVVLRGDHYEFIHPSFREYLSAAALVQAYGIDPNRVSGRVVCRWRNKNWRGVALFALGVLSDGNKDVTPLLKPILRNGVSGLYFSGDALADQVLVADDLASRIISALVARARRMAGSDSFRYSNVVEVLSRLGTYAPAVKGLLSLVRSKTVRGWVHLEAVEALGRMGRDHDLLTLARDETVDSGLRMVAALVLGMYGGGSRLLSDLECIAQQDADEGVRRAAQAAVERIRQRLPGK